MTAALEVFAERGFAATRLEEVAQRAGVSKGTVYLYFKSKEALFKAAVEAAVTPALEAAEALAANPTRGAGEALREFVSNWWKQVAATPIGALPKLLVAESGNFPELASWFHDNVIRRGQRACANIISQGIASGEFRQVDPMGAARIAFAPMFSYVLWRRSLAFCITDLPEPTEYFNLTLDILVDGLAVREEPSR